MDFYGWDRLSVLPGLVAAMIRFSGHSPSRPLPPEWLAEQWGGPRGSLRKWGGAGVLWAHLPHPQILERLNKMCGVGEQMRKKQQRLLKNMDAHKVMLDLLQIPYDKVTPDL